MVHSLQSGRISFKRNGDFKPNKRGGEFKTPITFGIPENKRLFLNIKETEFGINHSLIALFERKT